jgi:hypothetical protein
MTGSSGELLSSFKPRQGLVLAAEPREIRRIVFELPRRSVEFGARSK